MINKKSITSLTIKNCRTKHHQPILNSVFYIYVGEFQIMFVASRQKMCAKKSIRYEY